MKILVLNGSPKGPKSDTMHLTRAFLEGFKEVTPAEITILNVIDCHIDYCRGCFACMKNGGTCHIDDDMKDILHQILKSDIIIFSFPLYCYGMPASLKAVLDRTMPLSSLMMHKVDDHYEHPSQVDYSHLKYLMICGCGFPNSHHNFEAMIMQFKMMFPRNHTIITVPESPLFNVEEADPLTKPFLKKVEAAGREYATNDDLSKETINELKKPLIPEEQYAAICNGKMQ